MSSRQRGLFALARSTGNPTRSQRAAWLLFPASPHSLPTAHGSHLALLGSWGTCRAQEGDEEPKPIPKAPGAEGRSSGLCFLQEKSGPRPTVRLKGLVPASGTTGNCQDTPSLWVISGSNGIPKALTDETMGQGQAVPQTCSFFCQPGPCCNL